VITNSDIVAILGLLVGGMPLLIFFFLLFLGRIITKYRGIIATSVMLLSVCWSALILANVMKFGEFTYTLKWIDFQNIHINAGFRFDFISSFLVLMVTFVSFLVHLFSIEYLRGDKDFEKYFAYLGLFTSSMIFMILSSNLLGVFIFWELMGFSSYLLIGFWNTKKSAIKANKKAFLVNKIGDIGFLLGIVILWSLFRTFEFSEILTALPEVAVGNRNLILLAGFGLFLGTVSKSAQFPLHVWLPNAMEGPTPVSALIHAATMVAAGIYLMARVFPVFDPLVLDVVVTIGAITVLVGSLAAVAQKDIKRVLAYSTISQLGYMVMAMGVGAHSAALFHLITHAFFKACLFLAAGAIIHSMYVVKRGLKKEGFQPTFDTQNMMFMGGLRKHHPVTFIAFTIAAFSLIGFPLTSGFLSKETILIQVFHWAELRGGIYLIFLVVVLFGVLLTSFYMGRQYFLIFFGDLRVKKIQPNFSHAEKYLHHAPWPMRLPMILLAILSIGIVFGTNPFNAETGYLYTCLKGICPVKVIEVSGDHTFIALLSTTLAVVGFGMSYLIFGTSSEFSQKMREFFSPQNKLTDLLNHGFYIDWFYNKTFVAFVLLLSKLMKWFDEFIVDGIVTKLAAIQLSISRLAFWFDIQIVDRFVNGFSKLNVIFAVILGWKDRVLIDGFVDGVAISVSKMGLLVRGLQQGKVQSYVVSASIGMLVLIMLLVL